MRTAWRLLQVLATLLLACKDERKHCFYILFCSLWVLRFSGFVVERLRICPETQQLLFWVLSATGPVLHGIAWKVEQHRRTTTTVSPSVFR